MWGPMRGVHWGLALSNGEAEGAEGMASRYVVEHLNHLGIVAQVCREIGVADWLDAQHPGHRQYVSVGTATVALVLNGLGFSNRRLYLVPQFFADKPVEQRHGTRDHGRGPGATTAWDGPWTGSTSTM